MLGMAGVQPNKNVGSRVEERMVMLRRRIKQEATRVSLDREQSS